MTLRYRASVLEQGQVAQPRTGGALSLAVDALRRRDGLDVESELRRLDRLLRGLQPGDLASLLSRLALLEAGAALGRPIATYAGTTPGAVAPMTTIRAQGIQAIGNVGLNVIAFQFDAPAPSTLYQLVYTQSSGGTTGTQHRITTPTLTGFTLVPMTAAGSSSNPQASVWTFSMTVMDISL